MHTRGPYVEDPAVAQLNEAVGGYLEPAAGVRVGARGAVEELPATAEAVQPGLPKVLKNEQLRAVQGPHHPGGLRMP